jgi:hypothetical protein
MGNCITTCSFLSVVKIGVQIYWTNRSNRPQTKSAPSQIGPRSNRPKSNRPQSNRPHVIYIKLNGNTDIWLCSFSLMLRACWKSKNTNFYSLWFDISWLQQVEKIRRTADESRTNDIVLKNDTLFVPSGQSPRSECHSFKLIRGS